MAQQLLDKGPADSRCREEAEQRFLQPSQGQHFLAGSYVGEMNEQDFTCRASRISALSFDHGLEVLGHLRLKPGQLHL